MIGHLHRIRTWLALFVALFSCAVLADSGPIAIPPQATKTISCTSSSAATALATAGTGEFRQVELQNDGGVTIFVEFGDSTAVATVATGYPVKAGVDKVITIKPTTTHVACIVAATTTTLYATIGIGE